VFLLFLSAGAIFGGGSLIMSPDGSLLQMDPEWIELSPFPNYMIPGIFLFLFLGAFPLMALAGLFIKKPLPIFNFLNIFAEKNWGWTCTLYSGIISIIWIVIQQLLTSYFVLQPIIAGNGILIIIFCLLPRVQKYYTLQTK
jgi:hypothetical protein